jgi:type IV pilus assembly protein PilP
MMTKMKKHGLYSKRTWWASLGLACLLLVGGCSSQQYSDLDAFVKRVKEQSKGKIEPLPEIKPYESFAYQAQDLRSPFTPYVEEDLAQQEDNGITPPKDWKREPLEQYPLDSLEFVGNLERGGRLWGLIQAPDGAIHRVQVGNHLGKNYGEIVSINETLIKLKEIIPNGSGGWVEREASLALAE